MVLRRRVRWARVQPTEPYFLFVFYFKIGSQYLTLSWKLLCCLGFAPTSTNPLASASSMFPLLCNHPLSPSCDRAHVEGGKERRLAEALSEGTLLMTVRTQQVSPTQCLKANTPDLPLRLTRSSCWAKT